MTSAVPNSLRRWFAVHFAIDVLVAVPLFVAPGWMLPLLGWSEVDPLASRLVAAALLAIGGQSLVGRGRGPEVYRAMLNLKLIWSTFAVLGIAASLAQGASMFAWVFLAVFGAFSAVWWRYRLGLRPG